MTSGSAREERCSEKNRSAADEAQSLGLGVFVYNELTGFSTLETARSQDDVG